MNVGKKILGVIAAVSIAALFAGCFGKKPEADNNSGEAKPVSLPEGTRISRLFVYRTGSMMEMCFILCEKEDGFYMKMTYDAPYQRDEAYELPDRERFVFGVDRVFEDETAAESFKLDEDDSEPLREIEKVVEKYGALSWDGYKKENKLPAGVMDADYYAAAFIELSDGTCVNMSGSNAAPKEFGNFRFDIEKIFTKTAERYRKADKTCKVDKINQE